MIDSQEKKQLKEGGETRNSVGIIVAKIELTVDA